MKKIGWQHPRLRISEGGGERHSTWLEAFYDLLFAAVVAQLVLKLSLDISGFGLLSFAVLCVPVWWAWIGQTFYADRFDTDDLGHRFFVIAQMFAVAAMAVTVNEGLGRGSAGFALSYAAVRFLVVGEYLGAHRFVPLARPLTRRYGIGFAIAAAIWLISAGVPPPYRFWLWGLGILFDFATPLSAGKLHSMLAPHMAHLPERFGLFTLIVLGESIAAVVSGLSLQQWDTASVMCAMLGLSIVFSLWWVYFDNIDGAAIRAARTAGRIGIYQIWLYAHLPLVVGLAATAAGVRHVVESQQTMALPAGERWLICGAVALSLLAVGCILVTLGIGRGEPQKARLAACLGTVAAVVLLGAVGQLPPVIIMGLLALACAGQVVKEYYT